MAEQTCQRERVPRAVWRKEFMQSLEFTDHEGPSEEEYLKRREELLEEYQIPTQTLTTVATRLNTFLARLVKSFARREQRVGSGKWTIV